MEHVKCGALVLVVRGQYAGKAGHVVATNATGNPETSRAQVQNVGLGYGATDWWNVSWADLEPQEDAAVAGQAGQEILALSDAQDEDERRGC